MARTSNPLIGHSRNKIGGVVFSSWKGINTLRESPASVANPQTDGQVSQRSAMRQIVALARIVLFALETSFRERAVQMSQFNAFVKANLPHAFTKSGAAATFVPANLIAAQGTLTGFEDLGFVSLTGRDLSFDWVDNTGGSGANASDAVRAMVVSADGLNAADLDAAATRSDEGGGVSIPGSWSLTGARAAVYFVQADGSRASDSENIATA